MTDPTIGAFYRAVVLDRTKLRDVEGVLVDACDQALTFQPSGTIEVPNPVAVRVYRKQIVLLS